MAGGLPLTERLERAFADRVSDLPEATRLLLLVAALSDEDAIGEILEAARPSPEPPWVSTPPSRRPRRASSTPICRRSASGIR